MLERPTNNRHQCVQRSAHIDWQEVESQSEEILICGGQKYHDINSAISEHIDIKTRKLERKNVGSDSEIAQYICTRSHRLACN